MTKKKKGNKGRGGPQRLSQFPYVDYVLAFNYYDIHNTVRRALFETAMREDGLKFEKELIDDTVYVKIYCPFERLCLEAERIKLEMPLKGCDIVPPDDGGYLTKLFRRVESKFITDNEIDFVSAPFEMDKNQLFENFNEENFFRTSQRGFLTHHILINLDIWSKLKNEEDLDVEDDSIVQKRGLLYLLMKNTYSAAFTLHDQSSEDPVYETLKEEMEAEECSKAVLVEVPSFTSDPRKDLNLTWTKFMKYQPLWKIRNYFGENIAFYFAWQGELVSYLWIPSILGIMIYGYGLYKSFNSDNSPVCLADGDPNPTNATLPPCGSAGHLTGLAKDTLAKFNKASDNIYTAFFSLVIVLWGVVFMEMWKRKQSTLAYQWDVDNFEDTEPDRPQFFGTKAKPDPITEELMMIYPFSQRVLKFLVSTFIVVFMVSLVFLSVLSVLAYKVTMKDKLGCPNTDLEENSKKEYNKVLCLITTTVVPTLMNAISMLILGRIFSIVAEKLTNWENHRTQTQYNSSLIIKLFAFHFANSYTSLFYLAFFRHEEHGFQKNGIFGMGTQYKDTCSRGNCMPLLSFQVLVLMTIKPVPKFCKDIVWPWFKKRVINKLKKKWCNKNSDRVQDVKVTEEMKALDDSYIHREFKKPELGDFTLSEYTEKVITFGYLMMFSAAIPLAPFIVLIFNMGDNIVDAKRLLWWNRRPVALISSDIGMWKFIVRFIVFCGIISNAFIVGYTSSFVHEMWLRYGDTTEATDVNSANRLLVVIMFEHIVVIVAFIIHIVTPDKTAAVLLAMRKEKFQVTKILEKGVIPSDSHRRQDPEYEDLVLTDASEGSDNERQQSRRQSESDTGGELKESTGRHGKREQHSHR